MSQWRCKLDGGELGPMSFGELAELVRDGKVTEGTRVARVGSMNWEPAWHVPGLLRAAGITEPGDSPLKGSGFGVQGSETQGSLTPALSQEARENGLTPALSLRERESTPAGYAAPRVRGPFISLVSLVRGLVAAGVGVLAVGFFYRWAYQTSLAFPMPAHEVEGELIDCYFPLVGRCTSFECGLLYFDVFAVAALAVWHALRRPLPGVG